MPPRTRQPRSKICSLYSQARAGCHARLFLQAPPLERADSAEDEHGSAATDADIEALEVRLGTKLPPSYKSFLRYCNGLSIPSDFCDLRPTTRVDWFAVLEPEWVEIWMEDMQEVPDEEYYLSGDHQDSTSLRREYLQSALQISSAEDGDVFLLNPKVQAAYCICFGARHIDNAVSAVKMGAVSSTVSAPGPVSTVDI